MIILHTATPNSLMNQIRRAAAAKRIANWELHPSGLLVLCQWPTRHIKLSALVNSNVPNQWVSLFIQPGILACSKMEKEARQEELVAQLNILFPSLIASVQFTNLSAAYQRGG